VTATHPRPTLVVRSLGLADYETTLERMRLFTQDRLNSTDDELWVVQHPAIFTLGQAGKPEHILNPGLIPVIHVERGGQVTYHGPGQLVVYVLLDLVRNKQSVKGLVCLLEQAMINTLDELGIAAQRRSGAPGVYLSNGPLQGAKIGALGLKIKRGCSFHGLALNVDMDLEPFNRINPCGYAGQLVTQVRDALSTPQFIAPMQQGAVTLITQVQSRLVHHLGLCLGLTPQLRNETAYDLT
jgi:lipoyl(octanoyl) transferase